MKKQTVAPRKLSGAKPAKPYQVHTLDEVLARRLTPAELERIERKADATIARLNLRELRQALGKTQAELASASKTAQSEISKIEQRQDIRLSTLRRIVKALGGEVEVHAVFGARRILLRP